MTSKEHAPGTSNNSHSKRSTLLHTRCMHTCRKLNPTAYQISLSQSQISCLCRTVAAEHSKCSIPPLSCKQATTSEHLLKIAYIHK